MLVSIASFLPIIIVGPVADLIGTPLVILACAAFVAALSVGSILKATELHGGSADPGGGRAPVDPVAVTTAPVGSRPADDRGPS